MTSWRTYAALLAVLYAGHLYLWARLADGLGLPPSWAWAGAALALLAAIGVLGLLVLRRRAPFLYRRAKWAVALWVGLFSYAVPLFGLGHIADLSGVAGGLWAPGQATPASVYVPALLVGSILTWGLFEAVRLPRIRTLEVELEGLPPEAEGLVAVQIGDLHLSRMLSRRSLRRLVGQVNRLEPDLVLLTGDTIDSIDEVFPDRDRFLAELSGLRARLGRYAITGNHEFYARGPEAMAHLRAAGFRVLENEVVEPVPGLLLAGLHDISSRFSRYPQLRTVPEDFPELLGERVRDRPAILLYHQPIFAEIFAELGVDLMLSGHTHAGQVWPYGWWSKRAYGRFAGLYRIGEMLLYVSPGVGCSGPPLRIGARREITRVVLARRAEPKGSQRVSNPTRRGSASRSAADGRCGPEDGPHWGPEFTASTASTSSIPGG